MSKFPFRTSCWVRVAASRLRKAGLGRAAFITVCVRLGQAEVALEKMCRRVSTRVAFGKPLAEQSVMLERIAEARIRIDQTRLLVLKAADTMDKLGNKAALAEIAMIKVAAPNMLCQVVDFAIQAHGGGGYDRRLRPRLGLRGRTRDAHRRRPG
jgi:alkylation response protein AidB-like acyl-CoA dehydrogenase